MVTKKPNKCSKCESKNISISWCQGKPANNKQSSLITHINGTHGFVCKTYGEHFHYCCKTCGYAEC
jgi:hypothetical protein